MRNRFSGPCKNCGRTVEAGAGYFERRPHGWAVRCIPCTARTKETAGKPLSLAQAEALAERGRA